jgi:methionyl-tRNA synthetase
MLCLLFGGLIYMNEKIFIGVAWPYANGSLHLGHVAGCYLPADIFARYQRMKGRDVLMVSGSDEHGTPITITAEKEKLSVQDVVDRYNKQHTQNMIDLGISFDLFTRTTTENHASVVQDLFFTLYKKNFIYPKTIDSYFCKNCSRFLPDRYVEGICPHCNTVGARGDQCDACGKLIDSCDLNEVKCKLCGGVPVLEQTTHLFFSLSSFESKLLEWIEGKKNWKSNVQKFTYNWLKGGLKDRAVTRDIEWGIPVPVPGFEKKRIYVWFDAVTGYLSASIEWAKQQGTPSKWEHWWKNKEAKHYYFLAKDNIPFHSIIWPSMLLGYDKSLNLPYDIPANEYLCLSGEQFSKSRSIAVWVPDILKHFDADAIRYYLSINMPESKDANWIWSDFVAKNNDELVGTYGNFIHRVLTFTAKNFGVVPNHENLNKQDNEALKKIDDALDEISELVQHCSFKKGLRVAMNLAQFGNVYFDSNQPWRLIKEDKKRCATVLYICLKIVQALSVCTACYLPFSSKKIWKMLGFNDPLLSWDDAKQQLSAGAPIEKKPVPLFRKLNLDEIVGSSDPFSKLDLRVAQITEVADHPSADKLYVLEIDLGALGKRTIVAGIKPYYNREELLHRFIVVVANLKPVSLRGVESKGMLLAAKDDDIACSLLVPQNASAGAEVGVDGIARESVSVLDFNDFLKAPLIIGNKQIAEYNGKSLKSKTGVVLTDKAVKPKSKVC